jgi:adenine-specific DNA-methyltransferase
MNMKIELVYDGKESEESIINYNISARLNKIESFCNLGFDDWQNMLIFGDNLTGLRILNQNNIIRGKVKLIYIDPPFSTNQVFKGGNNRTSTISKSEKDLTAYDDLLNGSEYLEYIRKRLILMRELLADEGSIYIHIDCKIGHYVKIIMDEIFGRNRYVNDITRIKCNPKNFKRKGYGNIKDMVLFYTKTDKYMWNDPREAFSEGDIERLFTKIDEAGRRYTTTPLHAPGETRNGPTGGLWKGIKPPKGRHWRCKPEELEKIDRQGLIEWSPTGNPRKKIFAEEIFGKGKKRQDIWEFKDHPYPSYPTEKNIEMLKMIIDTSSNVDDLILDCFSGSGSTLLAAELTKRRWIGIDNSSIAIDVSRRRIKSLEGFSPFTIHHIVDNL